jgi:hypothetical protein
MGLEAFFCAIVGFLMPEEEEQVCILHLHRHPFALPALARGLALFLCLQSFFQHALLGVDHQFDPAGLTLFLIDIYGYLPPGGHEGVGGEGSGLWVIDDVGGVVLVLLLVEEEDGLGC